MKKNIFICKTLVVTLILITGCAPKPQPINFGDDQCDYCRMMITEREFGSQVVNNQGRVFKFDSVECMAAYVLSVDGPENIHSVWVPNFLDGTEWLEATSAVYLHSKTLRSPMGLYLTAYADEAAAIEMKNEYGGDIVGFTKVKEIVQAEWLNDSQSHNHQK